MGQVRHERMTKGQLLPILRVDEDLWGPGTEPIVKDWIRDHYNPRIMPGLKLADMVGRDGVWLLGWSSEGTRWPSLLYLIFGAEHGDKRIALNEMGMRLTDLLEGGKGEFGMGQ